MSLHVTFRQLQVFESVARHRSYTRAAEELHLTQPAVTSWAAAPRGPGAPHGRGRDGSEARRPLHGRDGSR